MDDLVASDSFQAKDLGRLLYDSDELAEITKGWALLAPNADVESLIDGTAHAALEFKFHLGFDSALFESMRDGKAFDRVSKSASELQAEIEKLSQIKWDLLNVRDRFGRRLLDELKFRLGVLTRLSDALPRLGPGQRSKDARAYLVLQICRLYHKFTEKLPKRTNRPNAPHDREQGPLWSLLNAIIEPIDENSANTGIDADIRRAQKELRKEIR